MFRIDKAMVSYSGHVGAKEVYTNVYAQPGKRDLRDEQNEEMRKLCEAEICKMLEEASLQAEQIIAEAKQQADELDKKARSLMERSSAEVEAAFDAAHKEGYGEGVKKAEQVIHERCQKEIDGIRSILEKAEGAREAAVKDLEDDIIDLVLEISKKVINVQIEKDDKIFIGIVENALAKLKREGKIVIRVSSEEYHRIFSTGIAELVIDRETVRASVTEEPGFRKGDCVVEADSATINAGIDSQLKYIELALRSKGNGSE